ncbi:MAG: site-specific DNA-methyltransferase [Oscillospiraceae bacterium]|nr:site-specific DNA-methyltransferase [Oscillospiraceae bacterium]
MPTLEWIGKSKVVNHHLEVPYHVLERKYSFDEGGKHDADNGSENMIIHGDNLVALKSLLPQYEGRIKCIYIDPPYNTGNENWVYNDNVNDPRVRKWLGEVVGKEGEDLSRHDKWLCMMYPRLQLLWRLLDPQRGVIVISIDENEIEYLKTICNEIFGRNRHVATIVWQKRYSRENRGAIGDAHEYLLIYATDLEVFKNIRHKVDFDEKQAAVYKNPNNDPKGRWRGVPMTAQGYRPNQMYPIETPSGKTIYPPKGRCWSTIEPEFKKLLDAGRIYFGKNGDAQPQTIRYLSEVEGAVPWTWWTHEEAGHTDEAKKEIMTILSDQDSIFDTPKPTRLIERIIKICTDKDDVVLDSFAGSGTTAHSVLSINKRDGGDRRFIMIEMMDYADTITAERVKRVIDGYGEGNKAVAGTGGNFSYFELGQPIFMGDNINEDIGIDEIRKYVYFTETKCPIEDEHENESAYMGTHMDVAYYFNYDRSAVTTLNREFLHTVKTKAEAYVIYADMCTLSDAELEKWKITFKKIPRDISKL